MPSSEFSRLNLLGVCLSSLTRALLESLLLGMHNACGKFVEMLSIVMAQKSYNLPGLHSPAANRVELSRFITNKTSALYPKTAINTQLSFKNPPLLAAYLYTFYTGPINTTNLNKRIVS